jgi:surface antigen
MYGASLCARSVRQYGFLTTRPAYPRGMKCASLTCLTILFLAPAFADPPAHAPAHGRRDNPGKGPKMKHRGYTGVEWVDDYGVAGGRCDTDAVLTAVGAVGGAVIGNRVASSGNRVVATIVGAIVGGVVGKQIGDAIDDRDRACMGHALEIAPVGQNIHWTNPRTRAVYAMRPVRDLSGGCREFEYRVGPGGSAVPMTACRADGATWIIRRAR